MLATKALFYFFFLHRDAARDVEKELLPTWK